MSEIPNFQQLIDKINALKAGKQLDLSMEEDLSIAVMNLVSLEEHFFFTASKTGKPEYLTLLDETRQVRKAMLARLINQHEGETWCISKHLLAATMRLMEVGNKYYQDKKLDDAKQVFDSANKIYSLFWALRLKLLDAKDLKRIGDNQINIHDESGTNQPWKFEDILNKLVNCCDE